MAYPYQISSSEFIPDPAFTPGPYSYNGNLYVALESHPAGTGDYIHIYKSSDQGVTWAEVDSGNRKNYESRDTNTNFDTFRKGSKLYITYIPQGGTQLSIAEFDMATDLWGTVITGGPEPEPFSVTFQDTRFKSFVLSNGNIRTLYMNYKAATVRHQIEVAQYAGSWGAGVVLFEPSVTDTYDDMDYWLHNAAIDPDDNIGIMVCAVPTGFDGNSGRFRFGVYSAAGSMSAIYRNALNLFKIDPPPASDLVSGPSAILTRSNGDYVFAFPAGQISAGADFEWVPGVLYVEPSDAVTSIRADNLATGTNYSDSQALGSPFFSIVYDGTALFMYWPSQVLATDANKIQRACSKGFAWSAPTDVFTPAIGVDQRIKLVCAQIVNTNKVGIVFSAYSDNLAAKTYRYPHYYQEDLPTCSAVGCSGGSGNINAAR